MSRYYLYCKKADFKRIAEQFQISPMMSRIIRNRDIITDKEIEEYLYGGTESLNDPFLMKGVKEAVPLLFDTLKEGGRIRIIGDYDTDGVCSSYILKQYLRMLGADVDIRLPDRVMEGYGMNPEMVKEAASEGVSLILTCDNGVSSFDAVAEAKQYGIRVIVSDHHEVPLPLIDADVVIDAKQPDETYPFHELCGAGVAYKIVCALQKELSSYLPQADLSRGERLLEDLLQFAGIATIADVVPLIGENRTIAKEGLKRLKDTKHVGLCALMKARHIEPEQLSSFHVGFIIAPCINSAGRLKHAEVALELLESEDAAQADRIAEELSGLNEDRKAMTLSQTALAESEVARILSSVGKLPNILVLYLPEAHESIAGIIAGRLKEDYFRPAIIITNSEEGLKGSGRSVEAYNMIEELRKFPECFRKLGGHAKAAGFSLNQDVSPEELSAVLNQHCLLSEEELFEKKWIDMQLPFSYISEAFIQELKLLEPFGLKNERPVFAEKNISVQRVLVLGKNNNVLKLQLENEEGVRMDAIRYGSEENIRKEADRLINSKEKEGEDYRISFTYFPSVNEFRGIRSLQVQILDFINY